MLQDIVKYDLLDLIVMDTQPEEIQADTVLQFTRALGGYVGQELSKYFTDKDTQEFQALLQNEHITPDEIVAFYKKKLPDINTKLQDLMSQFKRMFVIMVYENKVKELQATLDASFPNDPIGQEIQKAKKSELENWQKVFGLANKDNWNEVAKIIQTVQR